MQPSFDLTSYLNRGAENLIADVLRSALRNRREILFLTRFHRRQAQTELLRAQNEAAGLHVPMFLIASVSNVCNLYCKGCYARANGQCGEKKGEPLTEKEWDDVFAQAEALGIPFILLAGGEPFMKPGILQAAAQRENILFPIFTNGTVMDGEALERLNRHRNLVPVVSLEGDEQATDGRRGPGAYAAVQRTMNAMAAKKLLFGASVTVTTQNLPEITQPGFVESLYQKGCRLIFYIEYVPVAPGTEALAPGDAERLRMENALNALRQHYPAMVLMAFPGDEKFLGGCLAAGRGFFHINAYGGAEPCPFSPYSALNLREHMLKDALSSPFFEKIRELNAQDGGHEGGCALFAKEAQVRALLHADRA